MIPMYKIGVMGGADTVIGFKALGLDTFPIDSPEQAKRVMHDITGEDSDYAIIYLEETLAVTLENEINKFKDKPIPAIILIPGREGSLGLAQAALRASVERAVGSDIL